MGQPMRKAVVVDLHFRVRRDGWRDLRNVEARNGFRILRGRVTAEGAHLEIARAQDR